MLCHNIEAVTEDDALGIVGMLPEFVWQGKVRCIGLSSCRIDLLARLVRLAREQLDRPVDVVQIWGELNLRNL